MKKIVVIIASLTSLSLYAAQITLNTAAIEKSAQSVPTAQLINHSQVSNAIKSNDFTKLVKLLSPLKDAIAQIEAQNTAPTAVTDPTGKDKTSVDSVPADVEAQKTDDDNFIDDIIGSLSSLIDEKNPTNLSNLLGQAETLAAKQAQAAASPTNSMSAGRRAATGLISLLIGGAATYFGIVEPIEKKQDGTIVTGFMTAGGLVLYGVYDIYLACTNHDAKAAAAHAQVAVSTLKDLHTKAQVIVASSPRAKSPRTMPAIVSVSPPIPEPGNLIDLNAQVKKN